MQDITGSGKNIILFFFLSVFIARGKERVEAAVIGVRYYYLAKREKEMVGMIHRKNGKGELRPQIQRLPFGEERI